ncbi:methyltransferase domain-containing protein [Saccharopolyspora flava]|uniref:Ubiquinone/menaquinone biosynthesis C-methylase UbiE n=1 Tax=Saccharopolyspora flava TaxID=95161 RepID=A0A1I6SSK7_9PSEU|nr:methyltransferase domain-containing protein [Saccharopolyspora flava]SFS79868.1 Ubiquinone/menaquinone biosynthesis C-methylase UbiE [Saccharopolyspora flava]
MRTQRYFFDTSEEAEFGRLQRQAEVWDRLTFRRLEEIGVGEGWRCLEVGAGSGTVVRWLVDRVGATGRVVATDLVPKWVRAIEAPNLEVLEHDLVADPLEDSAHDLIHVRMVLFHLPEKQAVLRKLVDAVVPGGRLLVEDYDMRTLPHSTPPDETWRVVGEAPVKLAERIGLDPELGRRLPGMFAEAGLVDIDAEAVAFPRRMPDIPAWQTQFVELRDRLIDAGLVTAEQVDDVIARFDDPDCDLVVHGPTMHSVVGTKPGGSAGR